MYEFRYADEIDDALRAAKPLSAGMLMPDLSRYRKADDDTIITLPKVETPACIYVPTIRELGRLMTDFFYFTEGRLAPGRPPYMKRVLPHEKDHFDAAKSQRDTDIWFGIHIFTENRGKTENFMPFTGAKSAIRQTKLHTALSAVRPLRPSKSDRAVAYDQLGYRDARQLAEKAKERGMLPPRSLK